MHRRPPNACSPTGQNAHPEYPHLLIAIGHFGRQVLGEKDRLYQAAISLTRQRQASGAELRPRHTPCV